MSKMFKVSSQGIGNNFNSANGDYDSIEHGEFTSDSLYEIIQKFKAIQEIIPKNDEDICPPSLYVGHDEKDYSFYLSEGEIVDVETESKLTPMEVVNYVSGLLAENEIVEDTSKHVKHEQAPKGSQITDPAALQLVELLQKPVSVGELRSRFEYLTNGPEDPEFKRIYDIIQTGDVPSELKNRLKIYPPRYWALAKPGVFRRFFSFVLDIPLYFILFGIGVTILGDPEKTGGGILALWMFISIIFYFVIIEWLIGSSLGGMITGIRIVNKYGGKPSLGLCIGRQFPRVFRFGLMVLGVFFAGNMRHTHTQMSMGGTIVQVGSAGAGEVVLNRAPN